MMTDEELKFENLFKKHLAEWPRYLSLDLYSQECIRVEPTNEGYDLITYQNTAWNGKKKGYIVHKLYEIKGSIEEKYIGHEHEIIWRNMVNVLHIFIMDVALYTRNIELNAIRIETVKKYFDKRLQDLIGDENWGAQIALAKRYFKVNGVPIRKRKSKTEK